MDEILKHNGITLYPTTVTTPEACIAVLVGTDRCGRVRYLQTPEWVVACRNGALRLTTTDGMMLTRQAGGCCDDE